MKLSILHRTSRPRKDGKSYLYLRLHIQKSYLKIPLDIAVKKEDFNNISNTVTKGGRKKEYNLHIKEALGRASDIILKYKYQQKLLTKELFKKEFLNPSIFTDCIPSKKYVKF